MNLLGARDMSASQAPTAPATDATATTAAAAAVTAATAPATPIAAATTAATNAAAAAAIAVAVAAAATMNNDYVLISTDQIIKRKKKLAMEPNNARCVIWAIFILVTFPAL